MNSLEIVTVHDLTKIYTNTNILTYLLTNKITNDKGINHTAIKNINFKVGKGESFGVIGRNGAGKSTLLQIIAGTLRPSSGHVEVKGRVCALLELGSGFNQDFTGIENIYLAGAILGISRAEMDIKLASILSFADIGNFINYPVSTYSTGMLMRVAFSVAISVEPDLLIIDEALSVGDIIFQQKCVLRLKELINLGVTLFVVTHDTSFVLNICNRCLFLDKGEQVYVGSSVEAVRLYMASITGSSENNLGYINCSEENITLPKIPSIDFSECVFTGKCAVSITKIWCYNEEGLSTSVFTIGDWITIGLLLSSSNYVKNVSVGCEIRDRLGQVIFATGLRANNSLIYELKDTNCYFIKIKFQANILPAQYTLECGCGVGEGGGTSGTRIHAVSIIEIVSKQNEITHGLVKLPYQIDVHKIS